MSRLPKIVVYFYGREHFSDLAEMESHIVCYLQEIGMHSYEEPGDVTNGSIVLFVYEDRVLGDAVIRSLRKLSEGAAKIQFEPKLVRLYPRYPTLDELRDTWVPKVSPLRTSEELTPEQYVAILKRLVD